MAEQACASVHAADEAATSQAGARLARLCAPGDCLKLRGELGAGKTVFARGFIRQLAGSNVTVASPTFTLVQSYDSPLGEVSHFDLYRLKHAGELEEIGLQDALSGITLIEWPEVAEGWLPESALDLTFNHLESARTIAARGDAGWIRRLNEWQAA